MAMNMFRWSRGVEDVTDALPHVEDENSVEFETQQAQDEMNHLENNIDSSFVEVEDASEVLEDMKEVIVQHEANVQNMEGNPQPEVAETESGEVVAEVPAETQPQVDQNSSDEEVQEQASEMNAAQECFVGRLTGLRASQAYSMLGISSFGTGTEAIVRSPRRAYKEGLEGFKEFAAKVWAKIKAIFQSAIQWMAKWFHKAVVFLKGYERTAKKLQEQAKKVKDDAKFKDGAEVSPLLYILIKENFYAGLIPGVLGSMDKFRTITQTMTNEGIAEVKKLGSSDSNSSSSGSNSSSGEGSSSSSTDSGETNASTESIYGRYTFGNLNAAAENVEKKAEDVCGKFGDVLSKYIKVSDGSAGHAALPKSLKSVYGIIVSNDAENSENGGAELIEKAIGSMVLKSIDIDSDKTKTDDIKANINGKTVKTFVETITKDIISNIKKPQELLSKGNGDMNKVRNEMLKEASNLKDSKQITLISKYAIALSKLAHQYMVAVAYFPGVMLNVASDAMKVIGEAGEAKKDGEEKTEGEGKKEK